MRFKILFWITLPAFLGISFATLLSVLWNRVGLSGEAQLIGIESRTRITDSSTPRGVRALVQEQERQTQDEIRAKLVRRVRELQDSYLRSLSTRDGTREGGDPPGDRRIDSSIPLGEDEVEESIRLAEAGSVDAARDLAAHFLATGDIGRASHFAQLAALAGKTDPLVTLANYLADQNSKTVDKAEAFLLYSRAVEIGADEALLPLALYFEEGKFTDRDLGEAFRLIELAREKGIPEASYHAARFYESGAYARQDYEMARDLYLQAADAGMSEAYVRLGIIEREGYLGEGNLTKAGEYFSRAMDLGDAEAASMLSRLYSNPDYAYFDYLKSAEMWFRSAIMGDQGVRRSIANEIWQTRFGQSQIDGEVILNLMIPGAAEGHLDAIGMFENISEDLNLSSVYRDVANELRHDLLENGRFELAPELAEYELTSSNLDPAEAQALALSYLEFAEHMDGRSKLALKHYLNGEGELLDLIREYRSLPYEEVTRRSARSTATKGFSLPPMLLEAPAPVYPPGLRDLGIEGKVTVVFVVDRDGTARDIEIGEIEHEAFRKATEDALRSWRFEPGLDSDGLPEPRRMGVTIRFRPDGGD